MNRRIYKYTLPFSDVATVRMPRGAQILTVQTQREQPCIWAMVDADEPPHEDVHFRIVGTGHPADDVSVLDYIGTFQIHGGALVFHVFKVPS